MRVLFLAPRLPLPADTGGKIRTLNILKQIAKHAEVHLFCFSFDRGDRELAKELEALGIKVFLVFMKEPSIFKKILTVLLSTMPYSISKYYSKKMQKVLSLLHEYTPFDAVHIDHLHMAHYRSCFSAMPVVLDEHNVEYRIVERLAGVEPSVVKRKVFSSQARKLKSFESEKVKEFSGCLAVSEDDKNMLADISQGKVPVHVIPNGVDTQYFSPGISQDEASLEDALVFTGSMDWLPNEDSVFYFISEILPIVWRKRSGIKFYVVGKNPSARILSMSRHDKRIIVTGGVPDVRPFVWKSKVFVVPLRIGGGTRLKILEAMSMEKVVVSTTIGAEGISYKEGIDILLADTPDLFAQKVIELLDDRFRRMAIGKEGRKLVLSQYDWNIVGVKLNEIYKGMMHG